jgi:hypothetical protein
MAYDRNPKFGEDQAFSETARRVADLLWETTDGDLASIPKSYLNCLRHEYSEGNVSMLELIDRVDLGPDATYEDYCEVVDALMSVDPDQWPDPDTVVEIPQGRLNFAFESNLNFSEFNFEEIAEEEMISEGPGGEVVEEAAVVEGQADPISEKVETFFKKVIASVYLDGVTSVTDMEGNPPNPANNYLLSEDGKTFQGVFYDSPPNAQAKKFPFQITEGAGGSWSIKY